ncbi:hypothetical protein U472_07625 [Orenia metallireducens]|uniref:Uncharacterized protein n=1 Tax=Orenia metallireducens TaxID=1413210 RepID=A0A1C0AAL3_9FIRM|nr:hypothetical protein [Orenia metallireducens]OCL27321.1 hypothetical protein U472_07625 [Orenia metallireducens]
MICSSFLYIRLVRASDGYEIVRSINDQFADDESSIDILGIIQTSLEKEFISKSLIILQVAGITLM